MKESVQLFYREGTSDKVYHASLEPAQFGANTSELKKPAVS
ncbi:hypothetical protein SBV1_2720013 [Verrucomicrobia bacterium]|nr:hypothetical protein SBV1_2720013 [Verrucomicrobiota bacterium]